MSTYYVLAMWRIFSLDIFLFQSFDSSAGYNQNAYILFSFMQMRYTRINIHDVSGEHSNHNVHFGA